MTLEEALAQAWNGNAVAFLGSGFARGAKNKRNEDFKSAEELRIKLNATASGPAEGNLGDAAEAYRAKLGDFALIEELQNEFSATSVADHHRTASIIPWRRIYTTNYDNVFEVAAKECSIPTVPITLKVDPFLARTDGLQYVHLNGAIEGLVPEDLDSYLKLTDTSYVTSSIAQSAWATTFRNDLRLADVVFYFGYSLFDLDIKRIIYESPDLLRKSFFVLGEHPSALTKQRIERYGHLVETNVSSIATALLGKRPPAGFVRPRIFESVAEITPSSTGALVRDRDVFDLFELGAVKRDLVHQSLAGDRKYYLERNVNGKVFDLFQAGTPVVVLTSSLGNGKTLALEGLAYRAVEKGYRVFAAREPSSKAALEFERVANLDEPALLIVDDYAVWQRELRSYALKRKARSRLLLTARDTTHDVLFEKIESELGLSSIPEISVDKLTDPEIEWVVTNLNSYGLWGDLAGRSQMEKIRIIKTSLDSEMHGVLLRLLKSSDIGNRLRALANGPEGKCRYLHVVASVFILATLKTGSPRIEMLADIWGSDVISSSAFRSDNSIRNLLDFERWTIRARSAVVAEFFLQEVLGQDVVPVLIAVMKALSDGARGGLVGYRLAFEELVRFANLQRVLPQKGRLEAAIRFYEAVKDMRQAANHPLFWFQFGIACLAEGDLGRSRRYFTTAYSLAERTGFDTYQIDNHYARLLLVESSQNVMSADEGMGNFREARSIINRQLQKERLAYPFRVACGYQDFIDRLGIKLNENQLNEFLKAIDFVEERLEGVEKNLQHNRHVMDCAHAMEYVRKRCAQLLEKQKGKEV